MTTMPDQAPSMPGGSPDRSAGSAECVEHASPGIGTVGDEERMARATLAAVSDAGDPAVSGLVARLGAVQTLEAIATGHHSLPGFARYRRRLALTGPSQVWEATQRAGARVVVPGDAEWPLPLADLAMTRSSQGWGGTPVAVWARGPAQVAHAAHRAVAVVGSREATAYGATVACDLAAGLCELGWTVVSGGAYGIDGAAHRGALAAAGLTVAVLAGGVDVLYPRGNAGLLSRIGEEGLLLSEAPPGAAPTRRAFLIRNRLIAALGCGTVVVEAALRSGALNTATWANACLRVVMAVPGPVTSPLSAGTHRLLRDAEAVLVADAAEVAATLSPGSLPGTGDLDQPGLLAGSQTSSEPDPRAGLDERALLVLDALGAVKPTGLATVLATTGLSPGAALAALGRLSGAGIISSTDGGWRLSARARAWLRRAGHPR